MQKSEGNILNNLTKINALSEMRKYDGKNFENINKMDKFLENHQKQLIRTDSRRNQKCVQS